MLRTSKYTTHHTSRKYKNQDALNASRRMRTDKSQGSVSNGLQRWLEMPGQTLGVIMRLRRV